MDGPETKIELPEFPLFAMDDLEAVWGCDRSRYIGGKAGYEEGKRLGYVIQRQLRDEVRTAERLFFDGGRLTDFGFRLKPELSARDAHRAIQALLQSFAPSHEEKIGTVALAIHHWCDRCEPTAPEDAQ